MEVSMAQLFRLMCASFLFGGILCFFFRAFGLFLHAFSVSAEQMPPSMAAHLPAGWEGYIQRRKRRFHGKCARFFSDFLITVSSGIAFIIFLFWQADGIPRLFVFCAVGIGAYLTGRFTRSLFSRLEARLGALVFFVFLWLYVPFLRLLLSVASFFKKILLSFIKRAKRFYTICTARKYVKRTEKGLEGRRLYAILREAIFGKEEG